MKNWKTTAAVVAAVLAAAAYALTEYAAGNPIDWVKVIGIVVGGNSVAGILSMDASKGNPNPKA